MTRKIMGLDVGSVAVGVCVVDETKEIVRSGYRFHHGDIRETVEALIGEVDFSGVDYLVSTESTPSIFSELRSYDNELAFIRAARHFHPGMRNLLLVGGEKFSLSNFDADGHYLGSRSNTSCAAGTGSFLDQQAGRLNMNGVEELCRVAAESKGPVPKIASRCAVFAKTDLIHAQQEGYGLADISDGLCCGLAKNIVDTLFAGSWQSLGDVVFCGGVAKNQAVAAHISNMIHTKMILPDLGHLYGAVGACYMLLDDQEDSSFSAFPNRDGDALPASGVKAEKTYYYPPLRLELSNYPDFDSAEKYAAEYDGGAAVEVDIYRALTAGEEDVYLGIDIGSTSTKAVLVDAGLEVLAGFYTRTAGRPLQAVQSIFQCVEDIQRSKGVRFNVLQCGTTGSGRKFIGTIVGADNVVDEITAHARAACLLNPQVDTIIEIGGQDAKFTTLSNGRVTSSTMNTVCAAGTGSFIEEQAAKLGCLVTEYSARAENVRAPMVSDRCTVFMERDMNHYLSEGYEVNEVLAAALHAVRENYLLKVATEKNIGSTIFFQGATARNKALIAAFEQRLGKPILVSEFCHLTGALGTALILHDEGSGLSAFCGFDLCRQDIPIASEVCDICNNHCKISVANVAGSQVAYGFLCGRDYDTKSFVRIENTAFDLLKERKRATRFTKKTSGAGPVIGLPAAVHMVEDLVMWEKFFDLLGLRTVSSEEYTDGLKVGKKLCAAEFCAPVTAMHGHGVWLLDKADYVFLPYYLEKKAKGARRQYCYYTQFLPSLVTGLQPGQEERFLRPVVRYLYTSFHTKMQLYRMLEKIDGNNWNFLEVSQAYDGAVKYQEECKGRLRELMSQRVLQRDDISVVFLGRPYNVLSSSMNGSIPTIFKKTGVDGYFLDMLDYDKAEAEPLQPLLEEVHWGYGAGILEAAEVVAKRDNLYPVFLTSFKCSPDAFGLEYFKDIMDRHQKPYLILQLDEHDSSVGYETRIEAAVRAFRNHREQKGRFLPVDYVSVNPRLEGTLARKHVIMPNFDRITCALMAALLRREGYNASLMEETEHSIRESLKHNSGECIPLNAIAQGYMNWITENGARPEDCVLWLNESSLACNIKLYPHQIKQILAAHDMEGAGVYVGQLSFAEISLRAAKNAYFAFMLGGMLRRVACKIRPYEVNSGETDRVLNKSVKLLVSAFEGKRRKEDVLKEILSRFEWIETEVTPRARVAVFGDMYVRDNRVMNQDLVRFIEANGGEVITTPYSEYAKMIARSYFRKWFNEGKYFNYLTNRALLATMTRLEKTYSKMFSPVLGETDHEYHDDPAEILNSFNISAENTGESMDNILKIHYVKKHYPDVSLFVQTSPALCCASIITEAMREGIERRTGVPVVGVTYDGTGGDKNRVILPYLKYPLVKEEAGSETDDLQANYS